MPRARLGAVHPVLPTKDVPSAVAFYERLGFAKVWNDDRYGVVRRDGVELHLQWHDAAEWAKVERLQLRFPVEEVEALFSEFEGLDVFHERTALRATAWGTEEFAFFDADRNGLTFYRDR